MLSMTLDSPSVNANPFAAAPCPSDADEYRPTWAPSFSSTADDAAEWLGMSLRLTDAPAGPIEIAGTSCPHLLMRFRLGSLRGMEFRMEEEQAERERILALDGVSADRERDAMLAGDGPVWSYEEAVRAFGVIGARQMA